MTIIRKNFVKSILRESLIIIYVLVINSCNIAYGQEYHFRHGGKNKVPYKHKYGFCIRKEKNTLKPRKKDVVNFIQNAYADTTLYVNVNHNIISFFPLEDTSNLNVIKNFQGVYKVVNVEVKKDNYYVKNNHLKKIKLFMYDVEPVCAEEYALDYVRILVFQHKFKNSTEIMKKGRYYKISLKPFMQANCCTKINNSGDTIYRLRQSRGLYTYIINGVLVPYFNFSDYNIVEINKIEQITDKERVTNRIGGGMLIRNLKLEMSNYYSFTSPTIPNSSLQIPNWTLHPDHIGSSSWITFADGSAVEHLHYLPWGEDFVNQRTSSFSSMYTFSAKEKDSETGYSYFGSRYYNSDLSIWLSVDPMASKYPSLSPYTYCADNPVKLVDPDGEYLEVADNDDTHNDLLSIVDKVHQDRILFNKDGSVSVNMDGLSQKAIEKDIGLSLINDMVNSDCNYYFETSDEAFICDESGARCTRLTACDLNKGVTNASLYCTDSNGGYRDLPMAGFDGQVVIAKSGRFTLYGKDVRKNIVFHELEENYLRTDKKMNYQGGVGIGAHRTAARIENNAWGNFAGQCDYTPPTIPLLKSNESCKKYINYGTYK